MISKKSEKYKKPTVIRKLLADRRNQIIWQLRNEDFSSIWIADMFNISRQAVDIILRERKTRSKKEKINE